MSYRRKRLRKKLRVGEFQEFCFQIKGKLKASEGDSALDAFIDQFVDFLESENLMMGGFLSPINFSIVVSGVKRRKFGEIEMKKVMEFIAEMPSVQSATNGPLRDANYGDVDVFEDE